MYKYAAGSRDHELMKRRLFRKRTLGRPGDLSGHRPSDLMTCPPYAKVPSGELISAQWLTSVLRPHGLPADHAPMVTSFDVDKTSVIEGRHSTTFRLCLDWSSSTVAREGAAGSAGVGSAATVDDGGATSGPANGSSTGVVDSWRPMSSVFVKRMTCSELPARSPIKWRCVRKGCSCAAAHGIRCCQTMCKCRLGMCVWEDFRGLFRCCWWRNRRPEGTRTTCETCLADLSGRRGRRVMTITGGACPGTS